MSCSNLTQKVTAEIKALHSAFEQWFAGSTDDFGRIRASMAEDFTFISAGGDIVPTPDLLAGIQADHGSRQIEIRIADVVVHWSHDTAVLATYEEWQDHGDYATARRSTVLFTHDAAAPGELLWRHVHETWKVPPPDGA